MKDYISISTIKALLDNQLDHYEFNCKENASELAWNFVEIKIFTDDTSVKRTTKYALYDALRELLAVYYNMDNHIINGESEHFIYHGRGLYNSYDLMLNFCEE